MESAVKSRSHREYPARVDRPIVAGSLVGKKNQQGWLGIVTDLSGPHCQIYWCGSPVKDRAFLSADSLVTLDFGKENDRVKSRLLSSIS